MYEGVRRLVSGHCKLAQAVRMYGVRKVQLYVTVARQKSAYTSIQNLPRAALENQYIAAFYYWCKFSI